MNYQADNGLPAPQVDGKALTGKLQKASFWSDWKTRRPVDKAGFIIGLMAMFTGIPAFLAILFDDRIEKTSVILIFATQNLLLLLFFISLFFRERILRSKIEEKLKEDSAHFGAVFKAIASNFHSLSHEDRDLLNMINGPPRDLPVTDTTETLSQFCNDIRGLFAVIFANEHINFHVNIKAIVRVDSKPNCWVATLARDWEMRTHHNSGVHDEQQHSVQSNDAFRILLDYKETDFCDDDLQRRKTAKGYLNSSFNWEGRYNAALVVPIRRNHKEHDDIFELVGFLGIVCMRPPNVKHVFCTETGFAREELKDILLGYADCIYGILKRGTTYVGPRYALPGDYRVDEENFNFVMALHRSFLGRRPQIEPSLGQEKK